MSQSVRTQYDEVAGHFDERWAGYIHRTQKLLDTTAAVQPHERVLDVGCGTGAFEARLLDRHPEQHITGVDLSPGMLAEARRKLAHAPHVSFVEAPATDLPFPDASFDVVVSASTLHYVPEPQAALAEAARVLTPEGRLVVLDWDRGFWTMALLDRYLRLTDEAHHQTLSAREVQKLLSPAGLTGTVTRQKSGLWGFFVLCAQPSTAS